MFTSKVNDGYSTEMSRTERQEFYYCQFIVLFSIEVLVSGYQPVAGNCIALSCTWIFPEDHHRNAFLNTFWCYPGILIPGIGTLCVYFCQDMYKCDNFHSCFYPKQILLYKAGLTYQRHSTAETVPNCCEISLDLVE